MQSILLVLVLGYFAYDKFVSSAAREVALIGGKWQFTTSTDIDCGQHGP